MMINCSRWFRSQGCSNLSNRAIDRCYDVVEGIFYFQERSQAWYLSVVCHDKYIPEVFSEPMSHFVRLSRIDVNCVGGPEKLRTLGEQTACRTHFYHVLYCKSKRKASSGVTMARESLLLSVFGREKWKEEPRFSRIREIKTEGA